MNRFRPNITVSGCEPYAEDHWGSISIGGGAPVPGMAVPYDFLLTFIEPQCFTWLSLTTPLRHFKRTDLQHWLN